MVQNILIGDRPWIRFESEASLHKTVSNVLKCFLFLAFSSLFVHESSVYSHTHTHSHRRGMLIRPPIQTHTNSITRPALSQRWLISMLTCKIPSKFDNKPTRTTHALCNSNVHHRSSAPEIVLYVVRS